MSNPKPPRYSCRCGICGKRLQPDDAITVTDVGDRCHRCFNKEVADRLGLPWNDAIVRPVTVTDVGGARHRFRIRSMLGPTGHVLQAREVVRGDATAGYRFEVLGGLDADPQDLLEHLRRRIRQGLSVRHVEQTAHGWQLSAPHRLSGVIEWDADADEGLPRLVVDGRSFTWDEVGRMLMTFEGFTLNATVEDSTVVVADPVADGRQRDSGARARTWPPNAARLDALIQDATVDAYNEAEQATAFLTVIEEHVTMPFAASVCGETVTVEGVDLADARTVVALCRRRGKQRPVRLDELELTAPRPRGAEWIAAYCHWCRQA